MAADEEDEGATTAPADDAAAVHVADAAAAAAVGADAFMSSAVGIVRPRCAEFAPLLPVTGVSSLLSLAMTSLALSGHSSTLAATNSRVGATSRGSNDENDALR